MIKEAPVINRGQLENKRFKVTAKFRLTNAGRQTWPTATPLMRGVMWQFTKDNGNIWRPALTATYGFFAISAYLLLKAR